MAQIFPTNTHPNDYSLSRSGNHNLPTKDQIHQIPSQTPEFIYSVQCSLYKYDTSIGTWTNLCNSRNCVVQLIKRNRRNLVTASQKRSGAKFFEYNITNKLYFENLDDLLYQLQDRHSEKNDIWGISFLVRNDGMNFANKFEDLIQYEPGSEEDNVASNNFTFDQPYVIKEEFISMDDSELTIMARPLQNALEEKSILDGEYWIKILCGLPESHRRFIFELATNRAEDFNLVSITFKVENLNEEYQTIKLFVPYDITVNALKEIVFIKYGIRRELQKWITDDIILVGKDELFPRLVKFKSLYLLIMSKLPLKLNDSA